MQIVQIGLKRRVTPGSMLMIAYSSGIGVPSLHLQKKGTGNQFHHLERSIFSFFLLKNELLYIVFYNVLV